jgi:hypothetical protein
MSVPTPTATETPTAVGSVPPSVGTIIALVDPLEVNTIVNIDATFTDTDPTETYTAVIDRGDGATSPSLTVFHNNRQVINLYFRPG